MKILKLLNKTYLSILIIFFFSIVNSFSQDEPVDIWNIDKEQIQENSESKELISITESEIETEKIDVFNMQTKDSSGTIKVDENLLAFLTVVDSLENPGFVFHFFAADIWKSWEFRSLEDIEILDNRIKFQKFGIWLAPILNCEPRSERPSLSMTSGGGPDFLR